MGGPHLTAAVLCESVIEDKEGVLSLIRIVDQVTAAASGAEVPYEMPPFVVALKAVIALRADDARGRYAIKVRPEDPSGTQLPAMEVPVQLDGGERGVNLVFDLNFPAQHEGLYWFDVIFAAAPEAERLLTRMPLRVIYQPQKTGPVG